MPFSMRCNRSCRLKSTFLPEGRLMSESMIDRRIVIVDSTLRDGAQAPRVVLTDENRFRLAGLLAAAGVIEIEAGIPAMGDDEIRLLSRMVRHYKRQKIIAWCRARKSDLDAAERAGCRAVHIAFPVSPRQLEATGLDEKCLFDHLCYLSEYAAGKFDFFSVGAIDASRTDLNLLRRFCRSAQIAGAHRVRIADTVGILTPLKTARLIHDLQPVVDLDKMEFHAHNDFGMATANAVTAIESGVGAVSATVNGLGERAGNAALEEVVLSMRQIEGAACTVNPSHLQTLCETVAALTGRAIPASKPVSGSDIFLHESGIHWRAMLDHPDAFEPFAPALTGHTPSEPLAVSHCGGSTVQALFSRRGIAIPRAEARRLAAEFRCRTRKIGRALTDAELNQALSARDGL